MSDLWDGIEDAEIFDSNSVENRSKHEEYLRNYEQHLQKQKQECDLLEALYPATVVINFALKRDPQDAAVGCVFCLRGEEPTFWGRHVGSMTNGGAGWFAVELALDVLKEKVPGKNGLIFTCWSANVSAVHKKRPWISSGDKADVKLRVQGKLGGSQLVFKNKVNDQERYKLAHRFAKRSLVELPVWTPDPKDEPAVLGQAVESMTKASEMERILLQALAEAFPEPCLFTDETNPSRLHPARRGPPGVLIPQLPVRAGLRIGEDFVTTNLYFLDFAIVTPRMRLCVEVDGVGTHTSSEDKRKDAERESNLRAEGWRVLRFKGSEIWRDAIGCARRILVEIR